MGKEQPDIGTPVGLRNFQIGTPLLKARKARFGADPHLPGGRLPICRRRPQDRTVAGIARATGPALEQGGIKIEIPVAAGAIEVPDCQVQPQIDTAVALAWREKWLVGIA